MKLCFHLTNRVEEVGEEMCGGAEGFGGVFLEWVVIEMHHFVTYFSDFIELIDDEGSLEV